MAHLVRKAIQDRTKSSECDQQDNAAWANRISVFDAVFTIVQTFYLFNEVEY